MRRREESTETFGLKLDTEQLGALEAYKGTLMEPVNCLFVFLRYLIVSGMMTLCSSAAISAPEGYLIP